MNEHCHMRDNQHGSGAFLCRVLSYLLLSDVLLQSDMKIRKATALRVHAAPSDCPYSLSHRVDIMDRQCNMPSWKSTILLDDITWSDIPETPDRSQDENRSAGVSAPRMVELPTRSSLCCTIYDSSIGCCAPGGPANMDG
jgi:hypothetical protein